MRNAQVRALNRRYVYELNRLVAVLGKRPENKTPFLRSDHFPNTATSNVK